jgi:hypothetical protein
MGRGNVVNRLQKQFQPQPVVRIRKGGMIWGVSRKRS